MELWACGFNAHSQLASISSRITKPSNRHSSFADSISIAAGDPSGQDDIREFRLIASGEDVEVVFTGWSESVLRVDQELYLLGGAAGQSRRLEVRPPGSAKDVVCGVGTHSGFFGAIRASDSSVLICAHGPREGVCRLDIPRRHPRDANTDGDVRGSSDTAEGHPRITAVAVSLTSASTAIMNTTPIGVRPGRQSAVHLLEHSHFDGLVAFWTNPASDDPLGRPARHHILPASSSDVAGRQLLATATGWVLLTGRGGDVYTWGDPRFASLFGREISEAEPPEKPGLVSALGGLGVCRIAASPAGRMCAALTEAGEVYIWGRPGMAPPAITVRSSTSGNLLESLKEQEGAEPVRVNLDATRVASDEVQVSETRTKLGDGEDGDVELIDVAVGKSHILLLDSQGSVWVGGDDSNGQLGLGDRVFRSSWVRNHIVEEIARKNGTRVTGVECGHLTSFVTMQRAGIGEKARSV